LLNLEYRNSLSFKLLSVALAAALILGIILSLGQIVYDAEKTRQSIRADAEHVLSMFREPSTQAAFSLDREMGRQVVEGLLRHQSIIHAAIANPGEPVLAEKRRAADQSKQRLLTDYLLGSERTYSVPLVSRDDPDEIYGHLHITLDTAAYGVNFINNALVIFLSGILRSLVLGLILFLLYYFMLTKPLGQIIRQLSKINPNRPSEQALDKISGHEKDELGLWVSKVNQLLGSIERNTRLRQEAESSLQRMAEFDFLTGLPNRQQLQHQLARILADAQRTQHQVAVLCLGLDDFKGINEHFSYQSGDQLLVALAERLRRHAANLGTLARLGGDQFALIQSNIEQPYEAAELAQNVLDSLEAPFMLQENEVRLRATIGIALFPEDAGSSEELLQKSEQTMTLAKTRSRNRYQFYIASIDSEIRRHRELQNDLRGALARNEISLVYQPLVSYADQCVVGVEALARWQHPLHGAVSPETFIRLAEQNELIISIGEWILEQACRQLGEWHDQGFQRLRMSVNLSTVQLHNSELPRLISNLMQIYSLPANSLELEITETCLMADVERVTSHLISLRRSGALIAIDDFGTGYSSLSYLKTLPLDKIKIDRSFLQEMLSNKDDATIVRTIIQLGQNLGLQVVAEGVETLEQELYIMAQGCNEGQGYFYSKPLPREEMSQYLDQARTRQEQASIRIPQ
jgi:diguanylate cyclase (GGDEF)-like protein